MSVENPSNEEIPLKSNIAPEGWYSQKDLAQIRERIKKSIIEIHKYNPEYIFLTECSSIPPGYTIKEALRSAYPNGPLPKFYRVDPRQVIKVMSVGQKIVDGLATSEEKSFFEEKREELQRFFKERILNREAKILIFDEDWAAGDSPGSIVGLLKHPENFGFDKEICAPNVKMNLNERHDDELQSQNWQLNLDLGPGDILPITPVDIGMIDKVTRKGGDNDYNFRARIGNLRNKSSINIVKNFKMEGSEIGEELRTDLEKEAKLKAD